MSDLRPPRRSGSPRLDEQADAPAGPPGPPPAPAADPARASATATLDAPRGGCDICGRGPATDVSFVRQTGMLLARQQRTHALAACRECGLAVARDALAHNLALGWWGMISAVTNPHTLWENAKQSRRLRRLAAPDGPRLRSPLPHRPLLRRPILLLPVLVICAVVGYATLSADTKAVSALDAGDCFVLPTDDVVAEVEITPCSEPHQAEVVTRIPTFTPVPSGEACELFARDELARSVDGRITDVFTFQGGADAPDAGDVCFVHRPSGRPLSAS